MNPNIWNIKEILSLPPVTGGTQKASSLSTAASDYSSLTDSQFLLGSQFWPEQSQGLSQELNLTGRSSQQSAEGNERRIFTSYPTKPYLFAGDSQDKNKVLTLSNNKNKGLLERFEEDKRKAKERNESDMLGSHLYQLGDSMEKMKLTLTAIDGNIQSIKTVILEHLDCLTISVQKQGASVCESVVPQFESLLNSLTSQAKMLREIEDRETKIIVEMSTLQSSIQNLHQDFEILKTEHSKEQSMMGDILSLLRSLVSSQRFIVQTTDEAAQTSPHLFERFYLVREKTKYVEGMQLCCDSRPLAIGELEEPEKNAVHPGNVVVHTGNCFTTMSATRESKEPWHKSYSTISAGTQGLVNSQVCMQQQEAPRSNLQSPGHFSKGNVPTKDMSSVGRGKIIGEKAIRRSGPHGYKKPYRNGRLPRRKTRPTISETGTTWPQCLGESKSLYRHRDKVGLQLESSSNVKDHTEHPKPAWFTHKTQMSQILKTTPQNTTLWQLFNISDDSD